MDNEPEPAHPTEAPTTPPTKHPPTTSHTSHAHQDMEEYFDKIYVSQMTEHLIVDDGVESEEDNYFSPIKYKYAPHESETLSEDNASHAIPSL